MLPRLGTRKCVSRLKQVVFPAPLGPISAWIVPRRIARSTLLTATKPLNSFVSPRVSRMMSVAMYDRTLRRSGAPCPPCAADYPVCASAWQCRRDHDGRARTRLSWASARARTAEARRSLAEESVDAFVGIGIVEITRHHVAGQRVRAGERRVDLPVEGRLPERDDRRAARRDQVGEMRH